MDKSGGLRQRPDGGRRRNPSFIGIFRSDLAALRQFRLCRCCPVILVRQIDEIVERTGKLIQRLKPPGARLAGTAVGQPEPRIGRLAGMQRLFTRGRRNRLQQAGHGNGAAVELALGRGPERGGALVPGDQERYRLRNDQRGKHEADELRRETFSPKTHHPRLAPAKRLSTPLRYTAHPANLFGFLDFLSEVLAEKPNRKNKKIVSIFHKICRPALFFIALFQKRRNNMFLLCFSACLPQEWQAAMMA